MMGSIPEILLIEDNSSDAEILELVFSRGGQEARFDVVDDGDRALERLRALAAGDRSSFPSLVLLDLNLPCVSGTELISFASRDPVLKDLPIAILTSSEAPADRAHCESAGCVAYFVKPTSLQGYRVLLRDICSLLSELHGPLKSK